jgi:MerR HTH family regulatory protein
MDYWAKLRVTRQEWDWNEDIFIERYKLWTTEFTAEYLGVTIRTIRKWQAAELMPPRKRWGRKHYYRGIDIEEFKLLIQPSTFRPKRGTMDYWRMIAYTGNDTPSLIKQQHNAVKVKHAKKTVHSSLLESED